jgi:hypothetical protein
MTAASDMQLDRAIARVRYSMDPCIICRSIALSVGLPQATTRSSNTSDAARVMHRQ